MSSVVRSRFAQPRPKAPGKRRVDKQPPKLEPSPVYWLAGALGALALVLGGVLTSWLCSPNDSEDPQQPEETLSASSSTKPTDFSQPSRQVKVSSTPITVPETSAPPPAQTLGGATPRL